MAFKLAPVHVWAQGFAYALDKHRKQHTWNARDITNVTVYAGPSIMEPMRWIENPISLMQAQYSVPFGIAAALTTDVNTNPLRMNEALVSNPTTRWLEATMKKVKISDDPGYMWGYMTFNLNGETVNITADTYPGIPGALCFDKAVERKFANVAKELGVGDEVQDVRDKILGLKDVEDMSLLLMIWFTWARRPRPTLLHRSSVKGS
ncbi:uncharacterized protein LTR77_009186 [Saxophila tyrrhenica]|uniref:MmgE/PrpD C-terminal domain-containing protein n=1 Tax=Saxophila tyrrhenica TaxID=1690608 RepID=A0AAV9NYC8_9PEZI|nr:hypothetical protein LTR77_009186 [Saxophila tyrrhenica]